MFSNVCKTIILCLLAGASSGCAWFDKDYAEIKDAGPQEKVFFADFERVWRASQLALARYPMRINNMDTGRLETDFIKGARAWKAPASQTRVSNGQRYTLRLHVIRGKSKRSKAVKVIVEKDIELKRNFFSSSDQRPSDGLEEKVILYRIGRELIIEKALERAAGDS